MKIIRLTLPALVCFFFFGDAGAQDMNTEIVKSLNTHQSGFKTDYCKLFSNSVTFVNIGTPITVFAVGLKTNDKKMQLNAAYMTGAYLLSSVITTSSKNIFKAKRPFEKYPEIQKLSSGGGYSFPSGHTSAAFTTASSLCLYFPKWYVITPACLWASSVALARIYQGVHYPSDVLVGAAVGMGSAWITYKAQKWMEKKSKRKEKRSR